MLSISRSVSVISVVSLLLLAMMTPAAAQSVVDCLADPTSVGCEDARESQPGASEGGGAGCSYRGVEVDCVHDEYGVWIGDFSGFVLMTDADGEHLSASATGCWGQPLGGEQPPPPVEGLTGQWSVLSCLDDQPAPSYCILGYVESGEAPPDPEEVLRRAIAKLDIQQPQILISPPETGAGLIGLPVLLSVADSREGFGPQRAEECDRGLCVSIEARVERVEWELGDGETRSCSREEVLSSAWSPGMPISDVPCGYIYRRPSRDMPDGRYVITATAHWVTTWAVNGDEQSPPINSTQVSTSRVRINEMQVLVTY